MEIQERVETQVHGRANDNDKEEVPTAIEIEGEMQVMTPPLAVQVQAPICR